MPQEKRADERDEASRPLAELLDVTDDIEATASVVMMEAAQSAREDVKAIMNRVRAVNAAKRQQREVLAKINRDLTAAGVAGAEGRGIEFSPLGLGCATAYAQVPIAIPDPESPGGVRFAEVSLVDGEVTSRQQLEAAKDAVQGQLDSMSEMGEMESLRLQMAMDRLSKLMSTLSNILKKISETSQSITQNIK